MTSLKAVKQNKRQNGTDAQQSIPEVLQGVVVKCLERIWQFELRPYFQEVATKFKSEREPALKEHPDFPRAVIGAMHHMKALKSLNNFKMWDMSRFIYAINQMKKDPLKKLKGIDNYFINDWKILRNETTHSSNDIASSGFSDMELVPHVNMAMKCVPQIRKADQNSLRVQEIRREINELDRLLRGAVTEEASAETIDEDTQVSYHYLCC